MAPGGGSSKRATSHSTPGKGLALARPTQLRWPRPEEKADDQNLDPAPTALATESERDGESRYSTKISYELFQQVMAGSFIVQVSSTICTL